MAEYRITYWGDIPSLVEAFAGAERVRRPLSGRFQELIDAAAMRQGVIGTDAYLQAWRMGQVLSMPGEPQNVAESVAAQLEEQFDEIRTGAQKGSPPGVQK